MLAAEQGDQVKAEWGQQIRNYVMAPYKLVKDLRTGTETTDVQVRGGTLRAPQLGGRSPREQRLRRTPADEPIYRPASPT